MADQVRAAKPVIGLLGGMGSGKSRVAEELERLGAVVISGDRLGHEALRQPSILKQVRERWGSQVLDESGQVDRRKLSHLVFADSAERRALEALVFPWIEGGIAREIHVAQQDPTCLLIVLDAAVMLEAGWERACDYLVYVDAPREERLRRLAEQRSWTRAEVEARESAQLPLEQKAARADYTLKNPGPSAALPAEVAAMLRTLQIAPEARAK
jgi:dephospho-CoA kinase